MGTNYHKLGKVALSGVYRNIISVSISQIKIFLLKLFPLCVSYKQKISYSPNLNLHCIHGTETIAFNSMRLYCNFLSQLQITWRFITNLFH
jgi:hypothetical protein